MWHCTRCRTPHHVECVKYYRGCAIYACAPRNDRGEPCVLIRSEDIAALRTATRSLPLPLQASKRLAQLCAVVYLWLGASLNKWIPLSLAIMELIACFALIELMDSWARRETPATPGDHDASRVPGLSLSDNSTRPRFRPDAEKATALRVEELGAEADSAGGTQL